MLAQVKKLEGLDDMKCEVTIDEQDKKGRDLYLPEWDENNMSNSCLGGFLLLCRKNRIVCNQTLDERVQLVYDKAIPMIRQNLFPSFQ